MAFWVCLPTISSLFVKVAISSLAGPQFTSLSQEGAQGMTSPGIFRAGALEVDAEG